MVGTHSLPASEDRGMDSANSDAIEVGYSLPDGFGATRRSMYLQTPNPRFEKIGILSCQAGDNDLSPIVIRYQSFKIKMALDKIQECQLVDQEQTEKNVIYIFFLYKKKTYKNSYFGCGPFPVTVANKGL